MCVVVDEQPDVDGSKRCQPQLLLPVEMHRHPRLSECHFSVVFVSIRGIRGICRDIWVVRKEHPSALTCLRLAYMFSPATSTCPWVCCVTVFLQAVNLCHFFRHCLCILCISECPLCCHCTASPSPCPSPFSTDSCQCQPRRIFQKSKLIPGTGPTRGFREARCRGLSQWLPSPCMLSLSRSLSRCQCEMARVRQSTPCRDSCA